LGCYLKPLHEPQQIRRYSGLYCALGIDWESMVTIHIHLAGLKVDPLDRFGLDGLQIRSSHQDFSERMELYDLMMQGSHLPRTGAR
jgi:hypothetical protein